MDEINEVTGIGVVLERWRGFSARMEAGEPRETVLGAVDAYGEQLRAEMAYWGEKVKKSEGLERQRFIIIQLTVAPAAQLHDALRGQVAASMEGDTETADRFHEVAMETISQAQTAYSELLSPSPDEKVWRASMTAILEAYRKAFPDLPPPAR